MLACLLAGFVPVRLVVLVYALVGATRSRFLPAVALVIPFGATIVLPLIALLVPSLAALLIAWPWAPPLLASLVGGELARRAFARAGAEPAASQRLAAIETTAYALLANALIDAGLLVVAGLASLLVAHTEL